MAASDVDGAVNALRISGTLGVFVRQDGVGQLIPDAHPLHTFVQDPAPGQHNGMGNKLGDFRWGVVRADGAPRY